MHFPFAGFFRSVILNWVWEVPAFDAGLARMRAVDKNFPADLRIENGAIALDEHNSITYTTFLDKASLRPQRITFHVYGAGQVYEQNWAALEKQAQEDKGTLIVAFNFRGSQESKGRPQRFSEKMDDLTHVINHCLAKNNLTNNDMEIHGHGLGGIVAIQYKKQFGGHFPLTLEDTPRSFAKTIVRRLRPAWLFKATVVATIMGLALAGIVLGNVCAYLQVSSTLGLVLAGLIGLSASLLLGGSLIYITIKQAMNEKYLSRKIEGGLNSLLEKTIGPVQSAKAYLDLPASLAKKPDIFINLIDHMDAVPSGARLSAKVSKKFSQASQPAPLIFSHNQPWPYDGQLTGPEEKKAHQKILKAVTQRRRLG